MKLSNLREGVLAGDCIVTDLDPSPPPLPPLPPAKAINKAVFSEEGLIGVIHGFSSVFDKSQHEISTTSVKVGGYSNDNAQQDSFSSPQRSTGDFTLSNVDRGDTTSEDESVLSEMKTTSKKKSRKHSSNEGNSPPTFSRPRKFGEYLQKALQFPAVQKCPPVALGMVECFVRRMKKTNTYYLYHEKSKSFLLAASKRPRKVSSNIVFTTSIDATRSNSECFVGKLRGNKNGTEFALYDHGCKPAELNATLAQRQRLALIKYDRVTSFFSKSSLPRAMHSWLSEAEEASSSDFCFDNAPRFQAPCVSSNLSANSPSDASVSCSSPDHGDWDQSESSMTDSPCIETKGFIQLMSAPPQLDITTNTYSLDFNGRVLRSSIKNFQLVKTEGDQPFIQFGKRDDDTFILDFRHPVTALQAFGVCMSAFETS